MGLWALWDLLPLLGFSELYNLDYKDSADWNNIPNRRQDVVHKISTENCVEQSSVLPVVKKPKVNGAR